MAAVLLKIVARSKHKIRGEVWGFVAAASTNSPSLNALISL
jgi:hypothetical protein